MLVGEELEEERKIPVKLRRRGDLGGEFWWEGYGKIVLGDEDELDLAWTGADRGHRGRAGLREGGTPLIGLAERMRRSPCKMKKMLFDIWHLDECSYSSCHYDFIN